MEEIANSDARPIAIHHFGRILGWASGSGGGVFEAVDRLQPAVLPPAVALVLGFLLAAVFLPRLRGAALRSADDPGGFMTRLRRRGATSAIPVYTTVVYGGLAGISMELLIIYAFQLTHGYIYQLVGFIISLFMCGLPGGAAWARSRIRNAAKDGRRNRLFLMGILAATTVLAAVFPRLISLLAAAGDAGAPLFYFLTVVVGFLTGAIFPFSLDLQMKKSGRVGREAGGIDAADHLGAALGAFFCGALLLPVLGIAGVSFLVTGLTASAAILLGLTMPPRPH
jgi:hypothetical protein